MKSEALAVLGILLLAVPASAFWTEDYRGDLQGARYGNDVCRAELTIQSLEDFNECASESGFDAEVDDEISAIQEALDDLNSEVGEEWTVFHAARLNLKEQVSLGVKAVKDGWDMAKASNSSNDTRRNLNKCLVPKRQERKDEFNSCIEEARAKDAEAVKAFIQGEIGHGNGVIENFSGKGLDTGKMKEVVGYGEELLGRVDAAFASEDAKEIVALHANNRRLVIAFRLERNYALADYIKETVPEENSNYAEIVSKTGGVMAEVESARSICPYSEVATASNLYDYRAANAKCHEILRGVRKEMNDVRILVKQGRPRPTATIAATEEATATPTETE